VCSSRTNPGTTRSLNIRRTHHDIATLPHPTVRYGGFDIVIISEPRSTPQHTLPLTNQTSEPSVGCVRRGQTPKQHDRGTSDERTTISPHLHIQRCVTAGSISSSFPNSDRRRNTPYRYSPSRPQRFPKPLRSHPPPIALTRHRRNLNIRHIALRLNLRLR
jgi:hypothetical protein